MNTVPRMDSFSTQGYGGGSPPHPRVPMCGVPNCKEDACVTPLAPKEPWYMLLKPVPRDDLIRSDPVVLMKQDGWVLEKASEDASDSDVYHYCPSDQWKKFLSISEVRAGYCDQCHEDIPVEIVGAYTMHNWQALQQYDKNMELYGYSDTQPEATDLPAILVYR